jgi:hypothetical protein
MKFIWNEPKTTATAAENNENLSCWAWEKPIIGWLNYNNVWPDIDKDHWNCEYNDFYHFFDISIYECWRPFSGPPDSAIQAMRRYLERSGLSWVE